MKDIERWLPIKQFEGVYEVSDQGRIRRISTGRILRDQRQSVGYRKVTLSNVPVIQQRTVHSLVAEAFIGLRHGLNVNHKNGNKADNRASNLEYITQYENIHHSMRVLGCSNAGSKHGLSTLTEEDVIAIRKRRAAGAKLDDIAAEFNCSFQHVSDIARKKRWTHI
jgi:hypothetical protein